MRLRFALCLSMILLVIAGAFVLALGLDQVSLAVGGDAVQRVPCGRALTDVTTPLDDPLARAFTVRCQRRLDARRRLLSTVEVAAAVAAVAPLVMFIGVAASHRRRTRPR